MIKIHFDQIGIKIHNFRFFTVKMNRYDILLWFPVCVCGFPYSFSKTSSLMISSHLFWKLLCFKFWAKSHDNFSSVFFKSLGNFWHSLLQYLREKCFEKLRKVSISAKRLWLVILDHLLVSTKRSPHCKKWRERFPYGTIVIHKFSCLI